MIGLCVWSASSVPSTGSKDSHYLEQAVSEACRNMRRHLNQLACRVEDGMNSVKGSGKRAHDRMFLDTSVGGLQLNMNTPVKTRSLTQPTREARCCTLSLL